MDARKIEEIMVIDSRMLLDEIDNAILMQLSLSSNDEVKVRAMAAEIYAFLNIDIDKNSPALEDCLPEIDILDANAKFDANKFLTLVAKLDEICGKLENQNLRQSIEAIVRIGKEEAELAKKIIQDTKVSVSTQTLFGMSDKMWGKEIEHKLNLDANAIATVKKPNELHRDLFKRLVNPAESWLVILKTNGSDAIDTLNAADRNFFRTGQIFRTYDDANNAVMEGPIKGVPLCIELALSPARAQKILDSDESIKSYIRKLNESPVTLAGDKFSYVTVTPSPAH